MFSSFSLIMAILLFNISMLVVAVLRRKTNFLVRYSTSVLVLLTILSALRLALPLDFTTSKVINSYTVVPAIMDGLKAQPFSGVPAISVMSLLVSLWIGGFLFVTMKVAAAYRRGRLLLNSWRRIPCPQAERLIKELNYSRAVIVCSPDISTPMVTGIARAHIFLPELALTDEEMTLVLRHEMQHFILKDIWVKLFYLALSAVFWWNPIVHKFRRELDYLLELRCDTTLTNAMSESERIEYLEVIVKAARQAKHNAKARTPMITALVKSHPMNVLIQRFDVVLSPQPSKARVYQGLAMALVVMFFVASFFVIIQPAYASPSSEDSLQILEINSDNAYILFRDGVYELYVNDVFFGFATFDQMSIAFQDIPIIDIDKE